jgi:hypothetical protein
MDRNHGTDAERTTKGASNGRTTAAERLRYAVSASANGAGSRDELQAAARELAAEVRGKHQTPEQMLVQLKALLADAGLRAGFPPPNQDGSRVDAASLYRDIITWSIRYYYEGS